MDIDERVDHFSEWYKRNRVDHFNSWYRKNWDLLNGLSWENIISLYELFKDKNSDYSIQDCVEEEHEGDWVDRFNRLACSHEWNIFVNGEWVCASNV